MEINYKAMIDIIATYGPSIFEVFKRILKSKKVSEDDKSFIKAGGYNFVYQSEDKLVRYLDNININQLEMSMNNLALVKTKILEKEELAIKLTSNRYEDMSSHQNEMKDLERKESEIRKRACDILKDTPFRFDEL